MKLNQIIRSLLIAGACVLGTACTSTGNDSTPSVKSSLAVEQLNEQLVVTTWNVEHLAFPVDQGCKPRTQQELGKLKEYARSLQADIVALQEVASIKAARQLFSDDEWQIYISDRPDSKSYTCRESGRTSTQQKVAFAVRKSLKVNDVRTFGELGLGVEGLRYGLELEVESPLGVMSILNVHMKSGCFVDDYSRADSEACQMFAKQTPILDKWIESKEKQQKPYIVLGDFNHRLSAPYNKLTRELTNNANGSASSLVNTTEKLIGCHPYYPAPIDHIWAGKLPLELDKKADVKLFKDMAPKAMLSDHCAVSLTISHPKSELSNSVKWHTQSKEYVFLTESIYQRAMHIINNQDLPESPWTVVMDIDETVLDNSGYQVMIEEKGERYNAESWASWVRSENATLVPGADDFIKSVLSKGGKLALITNRDRSMDEHTWRNLQSLGLPVTLDNTCLMGRNKDDEDAINHTSFYNDKDLRRQQIKTGNASCYRSGSERDVRFPELKIVMQVGDNIEDFSGETQENANVKDLLSGSSAELILLPNAMYGSW